MRNIQITLLLLFSFGLSIPAARADGDFGNIHQGNVYTGGSIRFTQTSQSGSSFSTFAINTPLQYFIVDRFSLGVSLQGSYSWPGAFYNYNAGPAATYFFWAQDRWAASLGEAFVYARTSGLSGAFGIDSTVALNYFVTPSVAVGPGLDYFHGFSNSDVASIDQISVLARFLIYL